MKVLHLADIHANDRDIDEVKKCLDFIIERAGTECPDLIVVAGDIFNSQEIKLDSKAAKYIMEAFSRLGNISPIAVVIGTPSHDGKAPEILRHVAAEYPVYIADQPCQMVLRDGDMEPEPLFRENETIINADALLTFIPAPTKQFFQSPSDIQATDQEIAKAMGAVFLGYGMVANQYDCPHILIGHFSVGGAYVSETQQLIGVDIEISKDHIALAEADLVCLGHIHKAQQIGLDVFYSGSIYRKDFGEMEDKGFYIHDFIGNVKTKSQFVETPTRRLLKISADLTVEGTPINYFTEMANGTHVLAEIKMFQDHVFDKKELTEKLLAAGAVSVDIRPIRIPRVNVRAEKILRVETLREKLIARAELAGDQVGESILWKADMLETAMPEDIIARVSSRFKFGTIKGGTI